MELELICDNLDEQRLFKNRYYAKMVNFTGSDFGKYSKEEISTYVTPDFVCTNASYDSSHDVQIIDFEKSEIKKTVEKDEMLVSD